MSQTNVQVACGRSQCWQGARLAMILAAVYRAPDLFQPIGDTHKFRSLCNDMKPLASQPTARQVRAFDSISQREPTDCSQASARQATGDEKTRRRRRLARSDRWDKSRLPLSGERKSDSGCRCCCCWSSSSSRADQSRRRARERAACRKRS